MNAISQSGGVLFFLCFLALVILFLSWHLWLVVLPVAWAGVKGFGRRA